MKPVVAIVGRPNVGKSTLFNRILGYRKAITLDLPGVSRDRHYGPADWAGREFTLIDTGGIPGDTAKSLQKKVLGQIDFAIKEATAILLLLDGQSGLLPVEREIVARLRKSGKRIIFVVNKIDQKSHEERLAEFYPLGGELFPCSAEHGLGIGDLLDEVVAVFPSPGLRPPSPASGRGVRGEGEIRIAIIGRPNVGKSSLLNRLLGEERVVVDEAPGTTRDVIDTRFQRGGKSYRILDTAGIRRHGKSSSRVERQSVLRALAAIDRSDICLLVLDAQEGIDRQDAHVAGTAFEAKKGILILWNKWDLIQPKRGIESAYQKRVVDSLKFLSYAPVATVSAKTGWGIEPIWATLDHLFQKYTTRIPTSDLNRVFSQILETHNPPVYRGRPLKFFYATQTGVRPPQFVIFVNEPKGVEVTFVRFLKNRFREAFEFDGAPLEILFRPRG